MLKIEWKKVFIIFFAKLTLLVMKTMVKIWIKTVFITFFARLHVNYCSKLNQEKVFITSLQNYIH